MTRILTTTLLLATVLPGVLNAQATVQGSVRDETGAHVSPVIVTFRDAAAKQSFSTTGGQSYTSPPLPKGTYSMHIEGPGIAPRALDAIAVDKGTITRDIMVYRRYTPPGSPLMLLGLGLVTGLYLVCIIAFRWHNVRGPNRRLLQAQITGLDIRLNTELGPAAPPNAVAALRQHIEDIRASLAGSPFLAELLFWSRGQEIAAWARVHEIERQLVSFLSPPERVTARLLTARAELAKSADAEAVSLIARIDAATEDRKELLAEALALLYASRDSKFATWMEWHNKANWLLIAALIFIVALSIAVDRSILFLAGAAGGFMSRLGRTLFRADVPSDYGASWTTLYLSPVFGAISAWFGIAIIALLRALSVLGPVFDLASWDNPEHPYVLALAFVLGFSERLFNSLVAAVEQQTGAAGDVRAGGGAKPVTPGPVPDVPPVGAPATWQSQLLQNGQNVLVTGAASSELPGIAQAVGSGAVTFAGTAAEVQAVRNLQLPKVTTVVLQPGQPPVASPVDAVVCSAADIAAAASSVKPGGRLIVVDNTAGMAADALTTRHIAVLSAIGAANLTFVSEQKHSDLSVTVAR